ncbi:DUF6271 family protein [Kitasatospora sp. NPDC006697]|uniref:DUF6271 family protein n=1 Tax=Kitasatospora sp. NPDC006697 TaxID=3364020 RepID=UPI00369D1FD5
MRRICLALPTNRPCAQTIRAAHGEAAWGAERYGVEVHLLVLDSCTGADLAEHAAVVAALAPAPGVLVHHLDERAQRRFLAAVIERSGAAGAGRLLELMLPDGVSYGACTNRAFLVAAALGCSSLHRRDSDSHYQVVDGETVHPLKHELELLGRPAGEVAPLATRTVLDPALALRPVSLVGGSFIGEMSVDVAEIRELSPEVYQDVVSLWASGELDSVRRRWLVSRCFTGAGSAPFTGDRSTLGTFDAYAVEMCNIALDAAVYQRVPLPPALDTIGSDYFLIHLVHDAGLPGAVHNRHILNYYTPERRTDAGFLAYQLRFVKFLLSMLHLNHIRGRMARSGAELLDEGHRVRPELVAGIVRESLALDPGENRFRLEVLDRGYRELGGRYAAVADLVAGRAGELLDEARADMADFLLLLEAWGALIGACEHVAPHGPEAMGGLTK